MHLLNEITGRRACACAEDWKVDQCWWCNYSVKMYPAKKHTCKKDNISCTDCWRCQFRSSDFTCISYQYVQAPHRTVIQYIGLSTIAVQFLHRNSDHNDRNYVRSCLSVIHQLRQEVKHELPGNIYRASTGTDDPPVLHPAKVPRNNKQVQNAAYSVQEQQCLSHDALYNLLKITYDISDFVHKITVHPNVLVICGTLRIINMCNTALLVSPQDHQVLTSYDTTFCLGDFYVSVLIFRMIVFAKSPVLPVLIFIHNTKTAAAHKEFFERTLHLIPNLKDMTTPLVMDQELGIIKAIDAVLPGVYRNLGWNHLLQDVKRFAKTHCDSQLNVHDAVHSLLLCRTVNEYTESLQVQHQSWPQSFQDYYDKSVDPVVSERLGRWLLDILVRLIHTLVSPQISRKDSTLWWRYICRIAY